MPEHGTIHDSLYNAFSFGLFAAYELESEDRELLQKLISEYRSQYRRPNDARLIGKSDEELIDEYYGTKGRMSFNSGNDSREAVSPWSPSGSHREPSVGWDCRHETWQSPTGE